MTGLRWPFEYPGGRSTACDGGASKQAARNSARGRIRNVGSVACGTLVTLLLIPVLGSAQDVAEPALKAAFIYNFALFTEWPADVAPATSPLVMCVLGDNPVADSLERTVKGRLLAGHGLTVSLLKPAAGQHGCNLLYVSGMTVAQAGQFVAGLRDLPILTISDIEGFTQVGGIAQFFFEHGQLRFSVHLESARRARLQISSRLLTLSKRN